MFEVTRFWRLLSSVLSVLPNDGVRIYGFVVVFVGLSVATTTYAEPETEAAPPTASTQSREATPSQAETAAEDSAGESPSDAKTSTDDELPVEGDFAFGMNIRGSLIYLPNGLLGLFYDEYQGHWEDRPKGGAGVEFVIRYLQEHDLILAFEYQNYATADAVWLENDDPVHDADYITNDLRLYSLLFEYEWFHKYTPAESLHLYVGLGAGLSFVGGELRNYELNPACTSPLDPQATGALMRLERGEPCGGVPNNDDLVLGYTAEEERLFSEQEQIPRILPAFKLTLGLRYMIKERGMISIETGIFNASVYGGVEIGFMIPKKRTKEHHHAGGLQSADAP